MEIAGLSKEALIATGAVLSCFVDLTRISVYSTRFVDAKLHENLPFVACATLAAIAGAFVGNRLVKKVTLEFIQRLVSLMLIVMSLCMGAGLI